MGILGVQIYSWQGVNALELWARVLGAHADKQELRPLVYPLVQVGDGQVGPLYIPGSFPPEGAFPSEHKPFY